MACPSSDIACPARWPLNVITKNECPIFCMLQRNWESAILPRQLRSKLRQLRHKSRRIHLRPGTPPDAPLRTFDHLVVMVPWAKAALESSCHQDRIRHDASSLAHWASVHFGSQTEVAHVYGNTIAAWDVSHCMNALRCLQDVALNGCSKTKVRWP